MSIGTNINDPSINTFIVNYYFSVYNDVVTGFYSYNNLGINLLGPSKLPSPFDDDWEEVNNRFNENLLLFSEYGVNFTDDQLTTYLARSNSFYEGLKYINFYSNNTNNIFWIYFNNSQDDSDVSHDWSSNFIDITKIYGPPHAINFSMRSAYTNNAQVFYKSHSLASGGVGGTRNCRIKSKKT